MNTVNSTAMILCTCVVACVVIRMLLPDGRTKKTMNLIITAFLIIVMIAPVKNLFASAENFTVSTPDEAAIMEEYNDKVLTTTEENLKKSLISVLRQNNIYADNVEVSLRTDSENGILIDCIYIYINSDEVKDQSKIVSIVQENYNITPQIIYSE